MSEQQSAHYSVTWGSRELGFTLERTSRKTLSIQVHPDLAIRVLAPEDTPLSLIQEKVRQKAPWILKQQGYFLSFHPLRPPRRYVSGETHLYLGRQYRLLLHEATTSAVKLRGPYLHVWSPDLEAGTVEGLLDQWYHEHAKGHFHQAVERVLPSFARFDLPPFQVRIQKMEKRWGSCSPQGRITLNLELMQAPKGCIEYVVAHELCHLIHPNHNRMFFDLLSAGMPSWVYWKDRLEQCLS
jgi:predicted metal-dependent hydrolase